MDKICLKQKLVVRVMESLIDQEIPQYKDQPKDRFVSGKEAMELLRISSPTTLQKFRNEGLIEYFQLTQKHIIYDRKSIVEFIESKARKRF